MRDLISRQAAIDAVEFGITYAKVFNKYTGEVTDLFKKSNEELQKAVDRIESLPSAQPEPQWIPCSERLPEKPNMYTVTDSKGDVVRFVFYDTESSREYWLRCAKAWMPLPEPYRLNEANEVKEGD